MWPSLPERKPGSMTPSELADWLESLDTRSAEQAGVTAGGRLGAAAAMLREADRIIRGQAVMLTHEGLGFDGTDEWLGVPKDIGPYAADYEDWLEGRTA